MSNLSSHSSEVLLSVINEVLDIERYDIEESLLVGVLCKAVYQNSAVEVYEALRELKIILEN